MEKSRRNIGFTGTQVGMTDAQMSSFIEVVEGLDKFYHGTFHHGDCIGADHEAHVIMKEYTEYDIVIHPPSVENKRAFCEGYSSIKEPKPYLDRNLDIVMSCDVLIACPKEHEEVVRSGTWSTVRRATKNGKLLILIFPDGSMSLSGLNS